MAKDKESKAEAETVPMVESVTVVADTATDEELDTKFGAKQALGGTPLEKIVEARMSRPEPKRPDEDDLKLDHCDWVKKHFNQVAQKDIGARVSRDEWNDGLILVDVKGREGSISSAYIEELRTTHNLTVISKAMQAFLGGFLPEYRPTDE